MPSSKNRSTRGRLADLAWVTTPRRVYRRSVLLGAALADGGYLGNWPRLGPLLLPAAGIAGLLVGIGHPNDLYSYSLLLTTVLAAVSSLGASLGVWALAGFTIGDLTLARIGESTQLRLGFHSEGLRALGALTVTYVVLAGLLVLVPLVASLGRSAIYDRLAQRPWGGKVAGVALVAFSAGLAFLWTQSTAFLIRPAWSYFNNSPDVRGIAPLQQRGWLLALVVALAVVARLFLERAGSWTPARDFSVVGSTRRSSVPWWLLALGRSLFVTLMLSGLLAGPFEAALCFLAVLGVSVLHIRVLPGLTRYVAAVERIPLAVRLLGILIIAYLLGLLIVERVRDRGGDSFLPVLVATVLSLLAIAILLPKRFVPSTASVRSK